MVFNRHLKALNLCNHSDTIACVLYELLVNLELINVGFQTHDQGSTSFSFVQFSRSCCAVASPWQLVYYISDSLVCQEVFWKFFEEVFFKKRVQAVGIGFSGCRRGADPRDSLIILPQPATLVNRFFRFFRQILTVIFGQGVYGGTAMQQAQIVVAGRWAGGNGRVAGRAYPSPSFYINLYKGLTDFPLKWQSKWCILET